MKIIKRVVAMAFAAMLSLVPLMAQNYMVVDSKSIFESMAEYTQAIESLDNLAKNYQAEVDKKFDEVESLYNSYAQRASSLSSAEREGYESRISQLEGEATKYQESIFAQGGTLFKKRVEMLEPIRKRMVEVVEAYAKSKGYDLVLDEATSATVLYKSQGVDHTEAIINQLRE